MPRRGIKNKNDVKVGDYACILSIHDYGGNGDYMKITEVGIYHKENGEAFQGIGVDIGGVVRIFDRHSGFGILTRYPNNFTIYNNENYVLRYVTKEMIYGNIDK